MVGAKAGPTQDLGKHILLFFSFVCFVCFSLLCSCGVALQRIAAKKVTTIMLSLPSSSFFCSARRWNEENLKLIN